MAKHQLTALAVILAGVAIAQAQFSPPPSGPPIPVPASGASTDQGPPLGPPVPTAGQTVNPLPPRELLPPPPATPIGGPSVYPPQPAITVPPPYGPGGPIFNPLQPTVFVADRVECPHCGWATVDFLLWWVKPGPSPNPLVTTGPVTDPVPGSLGANGPNTTILFGEHNLDYGTFSGGRFNLGFWLPQCPLIGFDFSFFGLQSRSVNFSAASDGNGDQIISRPVIDAQTGAEIVYMDSYPGAASGAVSVTSTTQLYSWEISMDANMLHTQHFNWDLTLGFRALELREDLTIQDVILPLSNSAGFTFLGSPVGSTNTLADYDHFQTSNHFYGGQIGNRVNWTTGLFDVSLIAKVALGVTQQSIYIDGASYLFTPGSPTITAPGGVLAQQTNMGRYTRSIFTVVPEGGVNFGYQLTPWLRLQGGYTFVYWSDVVRPGNQIDRTVNPTQVATDQNYGTLTGPARPAFLPQATDFWAQGINIGLELRF